MKTWSTRQAARLAGLPEATARRLIHEHPQINDLTLTKAVLIINALKAGHDPACITLLAGTTDTSQGQVLISAAGTTMLLPNLPQAAAFLDTMTASRSGQTIHAAISILGTPTHSKEAPPSAIGQQDLLASLTA